MKRTAIQDGIRPAFAGNPDMAIWPTNRDLVNLTNTPDRDLDADIGTFINIFSERATDPIKGFHVVDDVRVNYDEYILKGVTLRSKYECSDGSDYDVMVSLRTTSGRWISTVLCSTPFCPDQCSCNTHVCESLDGRLSPPIRDEADLLLLIDDIPQIVFTNGDYGIELAHYDVEPKDITFFPSDYPHGAAIILPKRFVQDHCHEKFSIKPIYDRTSLVKPPRQFTLVTAGISAEVARIIHRTAEHNKCRHYGHDCLYDDQILDQNNLSAQDYMIYVLVCRELGIDGAYESAMERRRRMEANTVHH